MLQLQNYGTLKRKCYKDDLFVYFNKKYICNFNQFHFYFFPAKQQKLTQDKQIAMVQIFYIRYSIVSYVLTS